MNCEGGHDWLPAECGWQYCGVCRRIQARANYASAVETLECLPEAVLKFREAHDWSLRQVEKMSGVNYQTIRRLETGEGVRVTHAVKLMSWMDRVERGVEEVPVGDNGR